MKTVSEVGIRAGNGQWEYAETSVGRYLIGPNGEFIYPDYEPLTQFPRTEWAKVIRMTRYMEWKVRQMNARRWRRIGWSLAFAIGTPVVVAVSAYAWRFAVASILN